MVSGLTRPLLWPRIDVTPPLNQSPGGICHPSHPTEHAPSTWSCMVGAKYNRPLTDIWKGGTCATAIHRTLIPGSVVFVALFLFSLFEGVSKNSEGGVHWSSGGNRFNARFATQVFHGAVWRNVRDSFFEEFELAITTSLASQLIQSKYPTFYLFSPVSLLHFCFLKPT